MRAFLRCLQLLCLASAFAAGPAAAQDYPAKPVQLVVPNAAGTVLDLMARILAAPIAKLLGQPVVVENRPGVESIVGYDYVATQAPADGYTISAVLLTDFATLPVTRKGLRFDPLKDLPPIVIFAEGRTTLGSASKFPWKTFPELVANAKANPGKLNYGASGAYGRLLTESILRNLALNVVHVPYKGGAAFVQALREGEVELGIVSESAAVSMGDKFRVLAVTGENRSARFPEAPTFAQIGFPQLRGLTFSLNGRAGVPKPIIERLYAASSQALKQPDVRAQIEKLQMEVLSVGPDAAAKRMLEDARLFADIARRIGMEPQ